MAHRNTRHGKGDIHGSTEMWRVLVVGAAVGGLYYLMRQTHRSRQHRPADSAPRYVRQHRSGDYAVTGRTVTIARPRNDVYAFWRDLSPDRQEPRSSWKPASSRTARMSILRGDPPPGRTSTRREASASAMRRGDGAPRWRHRSPMSRRGALSDAGLPRRFRESPPCRGAAN